MLDILLPNYPESEPDSQYSMDLLFELHHDDSGSINLPGKIIGITADKDELSDKVEQFESLTWTIIHFTPFGDEWINQIVNCVTYLINLEAQSSSGNSESRVDVLVVCALQSPELDEVIKLPWTWVKRSQLTTQHLYMMAGLCQTGMNTVYVHPILQEWGWSLLQYLALN